VGVSGVDEEVIMSRDTATVSHGVPDGGTVNVQTHLSRGKILLPRTLDS